MLACESRRRSTISVPLQPGDISRLATQTVTDPATQAKAYAPTCLPDFAENLATDTFAARLPAGHYALRGSHDRDAQAALNTLDLIAAKIDTASRTRNALQIANDGFIIRAVFEVHAKDLHAALFGWFVVSDVALFFENAGNLKE